MFAKAVGAKNGGDANIKYAWFGASKDQIHNIFLHGYENIQMNSSFGHGVVLSPDHSPLESVESAIVNDEENFQSGVEDVASPKKFVVWSNQMNTRILPEFVVSFKTPSIPANVNRPRLDRVGIQKPISPWIPIPELIAALSKILPPKSMKVITQLSRSYIEHKIYDTRNQRMYR